MTDPVLTNKLRNLFLMGTAPSRLVREIAQHHSDDPSWPRQVQEYFWEAFSVVMLAFENKSPDIDLDETDLTFLNTDVLHDIIRRVPLWRTAAGPPLAVHRAWCDCMTMATDELELIDSIRPEAHPALAESWPSMDARAREFVRQAMVNSQLCHERVQVLSRLVEGLQKQVNELEQPVDHTCESRK